MSAHAKSAPALVIRLELEERPRVVEEAMTEAESHRLEFWIKSQPALLKLVKEALRLKTAA